MFFIKSNLIGFWEIWKSGKFLVNLPEFTRIRLCLFQFEVSSKNKHNFLIPCDYLHIGIQFRSPNSIYHRFRTNTRFLVNLPEFTRFLGTASKCKIEVSGWSCICYFSTSYLFRSDPAVHSRLKALSSAYKYFPQRFITKNRQKPSMHSVTEHCESRLANLRFLTVWDASV